MSSSNFHIEGILVQGDGRGIDARLVAGFFAGCMTGIFSGTEHEEKNDSQNNSESQKDSCVNDLFHM